ncbi:hypothetical protein KSS87_017195 [Heliosperma pusillum]|nr:hypothetical protein KSS87_017195 [Heliosperma pusillum]
MYDVKGGNGHRDDEIRDLEDAKIDLQKRINEEANGNAILQASLEKRKKTLHERRLALEKDVARLQEQLQKEKDLRAVLEAGSNISQVRSLGDMDEKTKNHLQEFALEEQNFNYLKQRFDDLGKELNLQHEHNAALLHNKILEGGSNNSALSKLTNRLNFLKERRNQIASELQFIDKSKGFFNQSALSPGKRKAPEPPIIHSSDKDDRSHQSSKSSETDNKDSNKKSDNKKSSNSSSGVQSSYSSGKWMSKESEKIEGDSNKKSSSSRSDVATTYSFGRGIMNESETKDNNKRKDDTKKSNSRTDATSSNNSGKGMQNEDEKEEGYYKDNNKKKKDDKRSSNSRSDAP